MPTAAMLPLAFLMLLASSRVELTDEVYRIPANDWRYVPVGLTQRTALVTARYDVAAGGAKVRVALLRREDVEKLRADSPHSVLEVTRPGASGELRYRVDQPDEYAVVVANDSQRPAEVRVRIWLDFGVPPLTVRRVSPQRQLAVVVISFAVFLGIVTWSARRLLKATRH